MRNLILFTALLFSGFISAQSFDFSCTINTAPTISPIDHDASYIEDTSVLFRIEAGDVDGDDLTFSVSSSGNTPVEFLADGSVYGLAFWETIVSSIGTNTLTFFVSDGTDTASQTVSFEVTSLPEPTPDSPNDPAYWGLGEDYSLYSDSSYGYVSFVKDTWNYAHIRVHISSGKWTGQKNDGGIVDSKGFGSSFEYQDRGGYTNVNIAISYAQWWDDDRKK